MLTVQKLSPTSARQQRAGIFYQPQKATPALQDSEHPFHITLELWLRLHEYLIPGLRASFPSLSPSLTLTSSDFTNLYTRA